MEASFLKQGLDHLAKTLAPGYSVEQIKTIQDELMTEPNEALTSAIMATIRRYNHPPPPESFLKLVQEEGRKARGAQGERIEREWSAEKAAEREGARTFFNPDKATKHARAAIRLLIKRIDGEITDEMYPQALQYMAKEFPGVGWEELRKDTLLNAARSARQNMPPEPPRQTVDDF
jgi:hypothetical protein